jgi:phosphoenolpyruvate-protein kinase (PTS system EI component)
VQYSLVVDREDSRMSSPMDAYHPAILRMIRRTVAMAQAAGKPVSVCGEMAARPDLAAALVALGVGTLSVVPRVIPELKQVFARLDLAAMSKAMPGVLACADAQALSAALHVAVQAASDATST